MRQMQHITAPTQPDSVTRLWWIQIPLLARRFSSNLAASVADGLYLAAYPLVGKLAPPACFLTGFIFGAAHLLFERVFSESFLFVAVAVALGVLSGQLGGMFLVGFSLGDFFIAHPAWLESENLIEHIIQVRIPLIIVYGLLSLLLLDIPLITKGLLFSIKPTAKLNRQMLTLIAVIGHPLITGVLVFFWTQIIPILIRPIFTWPGGSPSVSAMAPLQTGAWIAVFIAVAASIARIGLQIRSASSPELSPKMEALEGELSVKNLPLPFTERAPRMLRVISKSVWATLLMAGMMQDWFEAILLGGLVFFSQAARGGAIRIPLGSWPDFADRIPLVFRFFAGFLITLYISQSVLREWMYNSSFRPIVFITGLSLLVFYFLAPRGSSGSPQPRRVQA